jgi:hypothetical protein
VVIRSEGVDAITFAEMDWHLIGTYCSKQAKNLGRSYKQMFAGLPTIDHLDDGLGLPNFQICRWDTNDSKNDLEMHEFISLCVRVVTANGFRITPIN